MKFNVDMPAFPSGCSDVDQVADDIESTRNVFLNGISIDFSDGRYPWVMSIALNRN